MTTVAHVGHWLVDLIYVLPLLVMGLLLLAGRVRERRAARTRPPDRRR
jgi:cytochrome c oxidase assembly factor CtaG